MRKFICLLTALMMLLTCTALAETATETPVETELYTHPTFGYSLEVPSDWILLDNETIGTIVDTMKDGQAGTLDDATLAQYAAQIDATNMMMALSPDLTTNINVVAQDLGATFSANVVADELCPSLVSQYQALFADCVFDDPGSVVIYNDTDYARVSATYSLAGAYLRMHQYIVIENNIMYCLTFTATAADAAMTTEDMSAIALPFLESFVAPAA